MKLHRITISLDKYLWADYREWREAMTASSCPDAPLATTIFMHGLKHVMERDAEQLKDGRKARWIATTKRRKHD